MARQDKIGSHQTTTYRNEHGEICVQYHGTKVVVFNEQHIILDNGGCKTATTKTRMNQASGQFKLGFKVYQKHGDWFCDYKGGTIPFLNGVVILDIKFGGEKSLPL